MNHKRLVKHCFTIMLLLRALSCHTLWADVISLKNKMIINGYIKKITYKHENTAQINTLVIKTVDGEYTIDYNDVSQYWITSTPEEDIAIYEQLGKPLDEEVKRSLTQHYHYKTSTDNNAQAHSLLQPKIRLFIDVRGAPFFYEFYYSMHCLTINGLLSLGVRLNDFTIGIEIDETYMTLEGQDTSDRLEGSWNSLKVYVTGYYQPREWFELKWGLGGGYYSSSFNYFGEQAVMITTGELAFKLDAAFDITSFFGISLHNTLDLIFAYSKVHPDYYGGLRFNFHPALDWMSLYLETAGKPIYYEDNHTQMQTGLFIWLMGISFDMTFMDSFSPRT